MRASMRGVLLLLLGVLLLLSVVGMWEMRRVDVLLNASQCKEDIKIGLQACQPVIHGRLPSPECCERVRVSHVECVCPKITSVLAALVDVNKAIKLIQGCGRRVPCHFKCGSITTQ